MANYHVHGVNLSNDQMHNIATAMRSGGGVTIRLAHHNLKGTHRIPVTARQLAKLAKHHGLHTGADIVLSHTQLKKGGSILDWLKNAGADVIQYGLGGLGSLASTAIRASGVKPKSHLKRGKGFTDFLKNTGASIVQSGFKGLGDLAGNAIRGSGVRRKRRSAKGISAPGM